MATSVTIHCPAAHPRSRGEHTPSHIELSEAFGSSPLARGTHISRHFVPELERLIPARAGNTESLEASSASHEAHPRSHGEHSSGLSSSGCSGGSSPLARGTLRESVKHRARERLIPARAGNTRPGVTREPSCPAHPRSRGEHWWMLWLWWSRSGSSPLARGTRQRQSHVPGHVRLIPARAGNTPW